MARIGEKILHESRLAAAAEHEKISKASWKRRDLLSVLMRANMATDIPPNQRMTDADVLAREFIVISLFLI